MVSITREHLFLAEFGVKVHASIFMHHMVSLISFQVAQFKFTGMQAVLLHKFPKPVVGDYQSLHL